MKRGGREGRSVGYHGKDSWRMIRREEDWFLEKSRIGWKYPLKTSNGPPISSLRRKRRDVGQESPGVSGKRNDALKDGLKKPGEILAADRHRLQSGSDS